MSVDFVKSGISFQPYEATTRSGRRKFSHTKITLSREDGEEISEKAISFEPVILRLGDDVQDRYMFHPESVNLHSSDSTLTLYDGEKVLEQGTVNRHFQDTELGEVIEYIIGRRQDDNGVISGVKHPSGNTPNLAVEQEFGAGSAAGGLIDRSQNAAAGAARGLAEFLGNPEFASTSLNLTDMSPYDAIRKAASTFALDTWVDRNGQFNYGLRGMSPQSLTVGAHGKGVKLKEYNVSTGSGKLSQIILQGRYEFITNTPRGGPKSLTSPNVFSYGKAWLVGEDGNEVSGRSLKPDTIVPATNPKDVEDAARRMLVNHYMERKNGNLVLNAGASSDTSALAQLAVGDLLAASGDIQEYCERKVDTGVFMVQSVQHKLDMRRGWIVDVGVSALPASDIQSESWLENPEKDIRWDSVDDYGGSDFGS